MADGDRNGPIQDYRRDKSSLLPKLFSPFLHFLDQLSQDALLLDLTRVFFLELHHEEHEESHNLEHLLVVVREFQSLFSVKHSELTRADSPNEAVLIRVHVCDKLVVYNNFPLLRVEGIRLQHTRREQLQQNVLIWRKTQALGASLVYFFHEPSLLQSLQLPRHIQSDFFQFEPFYTDVLVQLVSLLQKALQLMEYFSLCLLVSRGVRIHSIEALY